MGKKKKKFYVVWKGIKTGIFLTWEECRKQVEKFHDAKYMSFQTLEEAEKAFFDGYKKYWGQRKNTHKEIDDEDKRALGLPISESIAVDGACDTSSHKAEYQGVHTGSKKLLFHLGPFEDGTNNIVEFLAIVHALSYCKKHSLDLPIYSDSKIAIGWIKKKETRTKQEKTEKNKKLFDLIERAIKWLNENQYSNKILKWETKAWGENPADFGRK